MLRYVGQFATFVFVKLLSKQVVISLENFVNITIGTLFYMFKDTYHASYPIHFLGKEFMLELLLLQP